MAVSFPGRAYLVRSAGDVNGDGFDDVLAGVSTQVVPRGIAAPEVRLLLGGPALPQRFAGALSRDDADATFAH